MDEIQKAGQDGIGRAMQSFDALSRGWQAITAEAADYAKQNYEEGAVHLEKLLGAKSVDVALEAQAGYVTAAYAKAVGQAARLAELSLDLVRDVAKPFEPLATKNGK
jgi:hypothetical protein